MRWILAAFLLWLALATPSLATISATQSSVVDQGNGVTTVFTYNFLIPNAGDVVVTFTDASKNQTVLTSTQYTITGLGSAAGGTVTYPLSGSPIASGTTLTIQRQLPVVQTTALSSQGPTFASIEQALDYGIMVDQQLSGSAITGPVSFPPSTPWVLAAGTSDVITAAYSPAIATLSDGLFLSFRATAANTTTTPTFSPNGLTAHTITRSGGSIVQAGDIPGNLAEVFVRYNLANTRWELVNPAVGVNAQPPWVAAGGTADAITATYSPAVSVLTDGLLLGFRATAANATTTPSFAPNGLTAHTITKAGGVVLQAGDIPANLAEVLLRYNLANTRWELLNPGRRLNSQTFTVNGTFTTPASTISSTLFKFTVVGGGGGAGGAAATGGSGGGGGSGATCIYYVSGLPANQAETVTVGAAANGGTAGANNGTAGNSSSIIVNSVTVTAGGGGAGGSSGTGSAPGGGTGGACTNATVSSGGGSGSPGAPNIGGTINVSGSGGSGGASSFGGGGAGGPAGNAGGAGTAIGSGGGGAGPSQSTAFAGGSGAAGIVIVEWVQ